MPSTDELALLQALRGQVCGPCGGGLHAVDDWVDLRQVRAFTSALAAVLADRKPHGE
jgi:acetylornithine deacetylase